MKHVNDHELEAVDFYGLLDDEFTNESDDYYSITINHDGENTSINIKNISNMRLNRTMTLPGGSAELDLKALFSETLSKSPILVY